MDNEHHSFKHFSFRAIFSDRIMLYFAPFTKKICIRTRCFEGDNVFDDFVESKQSLQQVEIYEMNRTGRREKDLLSFVKGIVRSFRRCLNLRSLEVVLRTDLQNQERKKQTHSTHSQHKFKG